MEQEIPNWAKDFKPRQNAKKAESSESTSLDLPANLATMDREGLLALVQRMACQCGLVANMTADETAQAMLDTLAHTALKPVVLNLNMKADINNRLTAIDKWLDRVKGKAVQPIAVAAKVEHTIVTEAAGEVMDGIRRKLAARKKSVVAASNGVAAHEAKQDLSALDVVSIQV